MDSNIPSEVLVETNEAPNSDILAAQQEVERAKEALALKLRAASKSGKEMLDRTLSQAKPLVVAAAALSAGAIVLGLYKLARLRPRARRRNNWVAPPPAQYSRPSFFGTLVRSALTSVAASLASHLMRRLQQSLEAGIGGERSLNGRASEIGRRP